MAFLERNEAGIPVASALPMSPAETQATTVPVRTRSPVAGGGVNMMTSSTRAGIGRKPSGARARAHSRVPVYNDQYLQEERPCPTSASDMQSRSLQPSKPVFPTHDDSAASQDVLAALSYLDVTDDPSESSPSPARLAASDGHQQPPSFVPSIVEPGSGPQQFKSSFAPSSSAARRKAKAQEQQAAHHAATHKPGRVNGKKPKVSGAWNDSTDEEEDEEEEDEEDADSDIDPATQRSVSGHGQGTRPSMAYGQSAGDGQASSHPRAPRTLPQPPGSRSGE